MSRYIECKFDSGYQIVWKYKLGEQASEMCRISTELGVGEYHQISEIEDRLILSGAMEKS